MLLRIGIIDNNTHRNISPLQVVSHVIQFSPTQWEQVRPIILEGLGPDVPPAQRCAVEIEDIEPGYSLAIVDYKEDDKSYEDYPEFVAFLNAESSVPEIQMLEGFEALKVLEELSIRNLMQPPRGPQS